MTQASRTLARALALFTLLGSTSLSAWAEQLRIERPDSGPVTVAIEKQEGERVKLELDRDNPDWAAVSAALAGMEDAGRWERLIREAVSGDGELSLGLSSSGNHQVKVITLPKGAFHESIRVEIEREHAKLSEEQARLQEESERLGEDAHRLAEEHRRIIIKELDGLDQRRLIIDARNATFEAARSLIEGGDFSPEQLAELKALLAEKG